MKRKLKRLGIVLAVMMLALWALMLVAEQRYTAVAQEPDTPIPPDESELAETPEPPDVPEMENPTEEPEVEATEDSGESETTDQSVDQGNPGGPVEPDGNGSGPENDEEDPGRDQPTDGGEDLNNGGGNDTDGCDDNEGNSSRCREEDTATPIVTDEESHKILICHLPPGNPINGQVIEIDLHAWQDGTDSGGHFPGGHGGDFEVFGKQAGDNCGIEPTLTPTDVPTNTPEPTATATDTPTDESEPTFIPTATSTEKPQPTWPKDKLLSCETWNISMQNDSDNPVYFTGTLHDNDNLIRDLSGWINPGDWTNVGAPIPVGFQGVVTGEIKYFSDDSLSVELASHTASSEQLDCGQAPTDTPTDEPDCIPTDLKGYLEHDGTILHLSGLPVVGQFENISTDPDCPNTVYFKVFGTDTDPHTEAWLSSQVPVSVNPSQVDVPAGSNVRTEVAFDNSQFCYYQVDALRDDYSDPTKLSGQVMIDWAIVPGTKDCSPEPEPTWPKDQLLTCERWNISMQNDSEQAVFAYGNFYVNDVAQLANGFTEWVQPGGWSNTGMGVPPNFQGVVRGEIKFYTDESMTSELASHSAFSEPLDCYVPPPPTDEPECDLLKVFGALSNNGSVVSGWVENTNQVECVIWAHMFGSYDRSPHDDDWLTSQNHIGTETIVVPALTRLELSVPVPQTTFCNIQYELTRTSEVRIPPLYSGDDMIAWTVVKTNECVRAETMCVGPDLYQINEVIDLNGSWLEEKRELLQANAPQCVVPPPPPPPPPAPPVPQPAPVVVPAVPVPTAGVCEVWVASDFINTALEDIEQDVHLYQEVNGVLVDRGIPTEALEGDATNPSFSPPRLCRSLLQHQEDEESEPYIRVYADPTFRTLDFELRPVISGLVEANWSPEGDIFVVRTMDNRILRFTEESGWDSYTELEVFGTMPHALSNDLFTYTGTDGLLHVWVNENTYPIMDSLGEPVSGERGEWRPSADEILYRTSSGLMSINLETGEIAEFDDRFSTIAFNPEDPEEAVLVDTMELKHLVSVDPLEETEVFDQEVGFNADWMGEYPEVDEVQIEQMLQELNSSSEPAPPVPAPAPEPAGELPPSVSCVQVNTVGQQNLILRETAGTDGNPIALIPYGAVLQVFAETLGVDYTWYQVEWEGQIGWIANLTELVPCPLEPMGNIPDTDDNSAAAETFEDDMGIFPVESVGVPESIFGFTLVTTGTDSGNDIQLTVQEFGSPNGEKQVFNKGDQIWVRYNDGSNEWFTGIQGTVTNWDENWVITYVATDGSTHQSDQFSTFDRLI